MKSRWWLGICRGFFIDLGETDLTNVSNFVFSPHFIGSIVTLSQTVIKNKTDIWNVYENPVYTFRKFFSLTSFLKDNFHSKNLCNISAFLEKCHSLATPTNIFIFKHNIKINDVVSV